MLKLFIKKYSQLISKLDIHTLEVMKKSSASMIVKLLGIIVGFLVSIFLGRNLGAEGLGIINLTNRVANILLVLSLFGMEKVLVKEIAIAHNTGNLEHIGNCMGTAYRFNGGLAIFISISFVLLVPWLSSNIFHNTAIKIPLAIATIAIIPMTFSRIFRSGLNGFRKIWQSNLVDNALSIWVVGLLLIISNILNWNLSLIRVAIIYAIGRVVVSISTGIYWKCLYKGYSNKFIINGLIPAALSLLMTNASTVLSLNMDAVFLGWLSTSKEVGLYSVAARIALLTSFFLQVSNASLAPKIASLYAEDKMKELSDIVKKVTTALFFLGGFTWLIFVLFGKNILQIWGNEFSEAYWPLVILGAGQFINLITGAVGTLLIMSGNEKTQGKISVTFLFINLVLNYLLITYFDSLGAAIASAFCLAGANITRLIYVKRQIGILTLPHFLNMNLFAKTNPK